MRANKAAAAAVLAAALALLTDHGAGAQGLRLDPLTDGILLGVSLPYAALSEYLVGTIDRDVLGTPDRDDVNSFDRLVMADYSRGLDTAGDVLMATTMLAPAAWGFRLGSREMITAAVIYLETLAFAQGAKNTFKLLVARYRPYVYEGGATDVDSREDDASFLSGHATMAFAAATAGVYLFSAYFPQSRWFVPLAAGAYGLATLTAAFRVAAGMHFMTDVASGAALGAAVGYAVPRLHRGGERAGVSVNALPGGLLLTYRY